MHVIGKVRNANIAHYPTLPSIHFIPPGFLVGRLPEYHSIGPTWCGQGTSHLRRTLVSSDHQGGGYIGFCKGSQSCNRKASHSNRLVGLKICRCIVLEKCTPMSRPSCSLERKNDWHQMSTREFALVLTSWYFILSKKWNSLPMRQKCMIASVKSASGDSGVCRLSGDLAKPDFSITEKAVNQAWKVQTF